MAALEFERMRMDINNMKSFWESQDVKNKNSLEDVLLNYKAWVFCLDNDEMKNVPELEKWMIEDLKLALGDNATGKIDRKRRALFFSHGDKKGAIINGEFITL